ncbi:hypothetical protein QYF36_026890 [Acer negundo]|nr:hypothetical protein QYF36_026890 [Acer negundo]
MGWRVFRLGCGLGCPFQSAISIITGQSYVKRQVGLLVEIDVWCMGNRRVEKEIYPPVMGEAFENKVSLGTEGRVIALFRKKGVKIWVRKSISNRIGDDGIRVEANCVVEDGGNYSILEQVGTQRGRNVDKSEDTESVTQLEVSSVSIGVPIEDQKCVDLVSDTWASNSSSCSNAMEVMLNKIRSCGDRLASSNKRREILLRKEIVEKQKELQTASKKNSVCVPGSGGK